MGDEYEIMATSTVYQINSGGFTLTCTFSNLTTGASRCSDAQDASATRYTDALFSVRCDLQTGAVTGNDNTVYVYLYGNIAGAGWFTDNTLGVDAAITLRDPNNLRGPYAITFATATGNPIVVGGPWSVANAFGGIMPSQWGIVIHNKTNSILGTSTNCTATYMKIWNTIE